MSKMHPNKNPESSDAPVSIDRRKLLTRGGIAAGGLATFAVGYGETLKNAVKGLVSGTAGEPTEHALRGNSLKPEFLITAKGDLTMANRPEEHTSELQSIMRISNAVFC